MVCPYKNYVWLFQYLLIENGFSDRFVTFFSLSLIGTLVENLFTSSYSLFNLFGTLFQYYWFRLFHTSTPYIKQIFTILNTFKLCTFQPFPRTPLLLKLFQTIFYKRFLSHTKPLTFWVNLLRFVTSFFFWWSLLYLSYVSFFFSGFQ